MLVIIVVMCCILLTGWSGDDAPRSCLKGGQYAPQADVEGRYYVDNIVTRTCLVAINRWPIKRLWIEMLSDQKHARWHSDV